MKVFTLFLMINSAVFADSFIPHESSRDCFKTARRVNQDEINHYMKDPRSHVDGKLVGDEAVITCEPSVYCAQYHGVDLNKLDEVYYLSSKIYINNKGEENVRFYLECSICRRATWTCYCKDKDEV